MQALAASQLALGGKVLGHVRLGAAGLTGVVELAGLLAHQVGSLDFDIGFGDGKLDALVLADRAAEDLAVTGVAQRRDR